MKNRVLSTTVVTAVLVTYFMGAQSVSAFSLREFFGGGRVKGETTTNQNGGFFQNMMRGFRGNQNRVNDEVNETGELETTVSPTEGIKPSPETVLAKLVTAGKMTQAQADELLPKLKAIKVKRDELMVLEKDMMAWFKTNKLQPKLIGIEGPQNQNGQGNKQGNQQMMGSQQQGQGQFQGNQY